VTLIERFCCEHQTYGSGQGVTSHRIVRVTIVFVGTVTYRGLSAEVCRLVNSAGRFAEARGTSVSMKAHGFLHIAASISD
jgi:hypothetical protein